MALTLAEAAKLSNDVVLQGVIETVVKESRVLDLVPFVEITGNALTYNRENTLPSAAFFDVGDTWSESTPTFTQVSASLKILGGDADVDQYIATTRSNVQDIEAAVLELKAKAVAHEFEDVPIVPSENEVLFALPARVARTLPSTRLAFIVRSTAPDHHVIGEYILEHSRLEQP